MIRIRKSTGEVVMPFPEFRAMAHAALCKMLGINRETLIPSVTV
jgi:hypothetical protein